MKLHELDDHRLVDTVRALIGLDPLHLRQRRDPVCGSYVRLESLKRLARPGCVTCGGSGYYDGERLDQRCACTGRAQRALSPNRAPTAPSPGFAYRGRRMPKPLHGDET